MDFEKGNIPTWYQAYLEEYRSQIEAQERMAEEILDENYGALYDFFCELLEEPSEIKILRARRCQVLFHIFLPIILLREGTDIEPRGMFISDNALEKYTEELKSKSWILVDDILIHGRGLKKIYSTLNEKNERSEQCVWVHFKSKDAELEEFEKHIKDGSEVFDWEWRELSCQLVSLIYASTSPYISFVGCYVSKDDIFQWNTINDYFNVINNANDNQSKYGVESYVVFEKETVPPIFEKSSYDCCLRIYQNKYINKVTCIPYIFLKSLDTDNLDKVSGWLINHLNGEKLKATLKDLGCNCDVSKGNAYRYRLLNALLNHIYGLYLWNKYTDCLEPMLFDVEALAVCYGESIALEFKGLEYCDVAEVCREEIPELEIDFSIEEDKELLQAWSVSDSCKQLRERCAMYFYQNWCIDEKLAENKKERKRGLAISSFYHALDTSGKHEMSACLLNGWDSGASSCRVDVNHDNITIAFLTAGEQSFRYILERFSDIIKEMIYAFNTPLSGKVDKSGKELAEEVFKSFLHMDETKQKYAEVELEAFEEFVKKNIDCLNSWALPEILN